MHKKIKFLCGLLKEMGGHFGGQANAVDAGQKLSIGGQTAASRADLVCTSTLFGYTRGRCKFSMGS